LFGKATVADVDPLKGVDNTPGDAFGVVGDALEGFADRSKINEGPGARISGIPKCRDRIKGFSVGAVNLSIVRQYLSCFYPVMVGEGIPCCTQASACSIRDV